MQNELNSRIFAIEESNDKNSGNNNEFEIIDGYNAKLGYKELWYRNNPYSCFKYYVPITSSYGYDVMPSRYTVYKANKKLDKAFKLLVTKANRSI